MPNRFVASIFLAGSILTGFLRADTTNPPATNAPQSDVVQLGHGFNLANSIEFTRDEGGGALQEADFTRIHDAGFDLIRIPIQWAKHTGPAPGFTIEPAFFERIDWVVAQAKKNHFTVILDNHKDDGIFDDPAANTDRFVAMWKHIAEHYKDAPPSVLFELQNEPHRKLNDAWNDLLAKTLTGVRISNPTRDIVVGPVDFNAIHALPQLVLPDNDKHLIVTIHYYDPMKFTHQGVSFIPGSKAWIGTKWGTDADKKRITDDFNAAAAWGAAHHRTIYLGEFGSTKKADMDSRLLWTRFIVDAAKAHDIPWTYWDYRGGYGPYDAAARQWRQPLLDALLDK